MKHFQIGIPNDLFFSKMPITANWTADVQHWDLGADEEQEEEVGGALIDDVEVAAVVDELFARQFGVDTYFDRQIVWCKWAAAGKSNKIAFYQFVEEIG